jgi:hypothetical protein
MALQTLGPISLGDIQNEFGGTNPISMGEYYRGDGQVPDTAANTSIPLSNTISLGDFYGGDNSISTPTYDAYFVTRATSETGACSGSGASVIVYQNSSLFNTTDLIYSNSSGTSFPSSGWYSDGTLAREWLGNRWGATGNICQSGPGFGGLS